MSDETNTQTKSTLEPLEISRNEVTLKFIEHEKSRPPKEKGRKYLAPKVTEENLQDVIKYFSPKVIAAIVGGRVRQWSQSIHKDSLENPDDPHSEFLPVKFINYAQTYSVRGGESIKDLRNELADLNAEMLKIDLTILANTSHPLYAETSQKLIDLAKEQQDVQAQIELKARNKEEEEEEPATAAV